MYELVAYYVELFPISDNECQAVFDGGAVLIVNTKSNECYFDGEKINAEQFVSMFEGENADLCSIIKRITGIDLDDYISEVTYKWGETEYLDVKGKRMLRGGWKKGYKDNK